MNVSSGHNGAEKIDLTGVTKEEFLELLVSLLKSFGINRYQFRGGDRIRFLPDMFIQDAIALGRCECDFFTNGLYQENPSKDSTLTLAFNLEGGIYSYIESYSYDDIPMMATGETLLEVLSQRSKKPFAKLRMVIAMLFNSAKQA